MTGIMKLTNKRIKALKLIEYFIPEHVTNWNISSNDGLIGIIGIKEGKQTPEECFFNKTEKGIIPKECSDIPRLRSLLWGHRWMAIHEKMYDEGFSEGTLLMTDFDEEPSYVREFVQKIFAKH